MSRQLVEFGPHSPDGVGSGVGTQPQLTLTGDPTAPSTWRSLPGGRRPPGHSWCLTGSQGERGPCPLRPLLVCLAAAGRPDRPALPQRGRGVRAASGVSRLGAASARLLVLSGLWAAVGCRGRLTSSPFPLFLSREKRATPAPPACQPTPHILPWPKVCAVRSSRSHLPGFVVCGGPRGMSSGEGLSVQHLTSENLSRERSLPVG